MEHPFHRLQDLGQRLDGDLEKEVPEVQNLQKLYEEEPLEIIYQGLAGHLNIIGTDLEVPRRPNVSPANPPVIVNQWLLDRSGRETYRGLSHVKATKVVEVDGVNVFASDAIMAPVTNNPIRRAIRVENMLGISIHVGKQADSGESAKPEESEDSEEPALLEDAFPAYLIRRAIPPERIDDTNASGARLMRVVSTYQGKPYDGALSDIDQLENALQHLDVGPLVDLPVVHITRHNPEFERVVNAGNLMIQALDEGKGRKLESRELQKLQQMQDTQQPEPFMPKRPPNTTYL